MNGAQFLVILLFGPETLYYRDFTQPASQELSWKTQYLSIRRIIAMPFTFADVTMPFVLLTDPRVFVATFSYNQVFGFGSIFVTMQLPILFAIKFDMGPQQCGLNFLSMLVG
jgi:hypothetical protein